jgi:glycosyltransferase involved in cell wall biosynthesis|tara:strand:+ start:1689 stop:2879 length:1191 start_codon:yes stop_codon:yes gene_type:complete
MKILFITPYLPSETSGHAGAQLISRNISMLAKNHEITLASFIDSDESSMTTDLISKGIDVHTILYPRNQKSIIGKMSSGIRNSVAMFNYLKGTEPFFFAKYKRKNMENLISTLVNENRFDLVQVEYNVMHHYKKQIKNIPSVIVFHDISTKVHERGMINGDSTHKKSFEIAKRLEPEIGNKFDTVITLTEEDKLYLANLGCETKIHVIPPQINVPNIDKIAKTPNSICFVGSYNREPNIQAVEILINEVFPKISCSVSLNIVGKGLGRKIIQTIHNLEGVNYLGFVDDIDSFIASQMLMVAPIHMGAGLKMKITHSLACGTPVLTTPIGAEGINIGSENGLWIEESLEALSEKCLELMKNGQELEKAGLRGKEAVNRLFSPPRVTTKLNALYLSLT